MCNAALARWLPDVSRGTVAALLVLAPVAAPLAYASGGFAGTAVVVHGTATIATSGNVQTITLPTSSAVTTINWTPTDTATGGGAINFLPAGQTVNYVGTTDTGLTYNVLNRIIPTDQTRTVAFNGAVNSTANTHVWFYSPGGLLIGKTAVFNVGGLVLTTAEPVLDTDNNFITTSSGTDTFSFAGVAGSTSAITIAPGAKISAISSAQSNYIVAIAPQINQGGSIAVAGSVALVAAESASFAVDPTGLFNITVSAGTTVADNTFVHTGSTGGPGTPFQGGFQRVYMVAVPKNNAITMAIASGGSIGFAVADAANTDGEEIVLSAGGNIADITGEGSGNPVVAGRAGGGTANLTVGGGSYTSNTYAISTDAVTVTDPALNIAFASDLTMVSPRTTINALAGTISVGGNLIEDSGDTLGGTGGIAKLAAHGGAITVTGDALVNAQGSWGGGTQNPGNISAQGGTAQVAVSGGKLSVGGMLTVDASADATGANAALAPTASPYFDSGDTASGGSALVTVSGAGATLIATNGIAARANAISSFDQGGDGGNATGGTALIEAQTGGAMSVGASGTIAATASASSVDPQQNVNYAASATGGTAQVIANAGSIEVAGVNGITAFANATGSSAGNYSGAGGSAIGGTALIATQGANGSIATNTSGSTVQSDPFSGVEANAFGGNAGSGYFGGNATGGSATVQVNGAGQSIAFDHDMVAIHAGAWGGTGSGGGGGYATGGTAQLLVSGGSVTVTNSALDIDASGTGGVDNENRGGGATGGMVQLAASGGGSFFATVSTGQLPGVSTTLTAAATGGSSDGGAGGAATGGTVKLSASGGGAVTMDDSPFISVLTSGGSGSGTGGNAVGGNIFIAMGENGINFDPVGGTPELDAGYTPGNSNGGPLATGSSAGGVLVTDLGTLNLAGDLQIDNNTAFYAQAGGSINVSGSISGTNPGAYLHLWADDLGTGIGTVTLASGALNLPGNLIDIYYNPTALGTPTDFSAGVKAGTATAYQLVDNIDQLQLVGSYLSQNFALGKNIDASATQGWNGGAGFFTIGNSYEPFTGNVDGLNHTITNLYINSASDVGLFGQVGAGTGANILIRNIGLVDPEISGIGQVGSLVGLAGSTNGTADSIKITNSYSSGGLVSGSDTVGGLIGQVFTPGASSALSNIHSDTAVLVAGNFSDNAGGLIGQAENAIITNAYATGSVTVNSTYAANVGGLIGQQYEGSLSHAYATGAVVAPSGQDVGGLIGQLGYGGTVTQVYSTSRVTAGGGSYVGGLVGELNEGSSINESWASGAISAASGTNVGGFVGGIRSGTITNSYWDTYSTGQAAGVSNNGSTVTNLNPVTSDPAQTNADNYAFNQYAYTNLPSADWTYDNQMTRPVGAWETPVAQFGVANIESAHQVQLIDFNMAGSYLVTQNIDMRGTGSASDIWGPEGFMPLGGIPTDPPLTGTLAGGGHVLSNLTMAPDGNFYNAGLVQENYGTIKDLGLANVNITAANSYSVGAIAGYNAGQITDSFATGTITLTGAAAGSGVAGGLVGLNYDGALYMNEAALISYFVGNRGTISQSYASVAVSGGSAVGGLVGDNEGGIDGSFANGSVSGTLTGGLVGTSIDTSGPTVTNSYWDTELTGQGIACGSLGYSGACGGATGLTNAQTLQSASFNDFSIDTQGGEGLPWRQYEGDTTPLLAAFLTPIIVQPGSLTQQYNAQNPEVGYTAYGAQPSLTFGNAVISGLTRNAGTYDLTYAGGLYSSQLGYDFIPSTTAGSLVITPAPLTLGAVSDTKVYDATTSSAGQVQTSGLYDGDSISNVSQSFISPNALGEQASTLLVNSGYVINDGNGGNNYSVTTTSAQGTITPAALTLAAVSDTKGYDATTNSAGQVAVSGLFGGDNVTSLTQSFNSPNVMGTNGSTLTVDPGYSVNDGNGGGNYTVTLQNAQGTINPAALTLAAVSDSRSYDATTGSTGEVQASGLFGQDSVTSLTQSFASANALGTNGSTLVVNSGYVVNDGKGGGNYTVTLQSAQGTITPAALTLAAVTDTRGYNATTNSTGEVQASGLFGDDSVTSLTQSFASKNVLGTNGSTLLVNSGYVINDGNGGGNYTVALRNAAGTISPAALAITYTANATSSTYGTTPSGLSGTVSQQGLQGSDTLGAVTSGTASFTTTATAQSNVGSYAITGSGLAGNSGNYTFSFAQAPGNATALTITPANMIVDVLADAQSRSYGAANPPLTYTETGLTNRDTLTGSLATTATATSNVGTYAITIGTLSAGSNYSLSFTGANLTVTPANLTVTYTAGTFASIYGTAIGTPGGRVSAAGLVLGQTLGSVTSGAAVFTTAANATSNVGTYAVTGSGLAANSGNYAFNFVQAAGNASALTIVPRALTLTPDALSRVYGSANPVSDTATAAAATDTTGLVNGDSVGSERVTSSATSGSGVGAYALNGSAAQFGSGLASNYAITYAANSTGLTITPAAATITYLANAQNSIYGNAPSGLSGTESATGLVNSDTLASVTSGTAGFATTATGLSNVGQYAITGSGLTGNSSNYNFTFVQAAGNATALAIVQRALTLTADPLSRVYGSANPVTDTATATTIPGVPSNGLVNGDSVASETVTSPAGSGSGVGTYGLNGSAARFGSGLASNYAITYAANTSGLSITPAAATVTYVANAQNSIYGNAPTGLSGSESATGLVNGDTLGSVTSGTATFATTATGLSNVGSYAITGSGLAGESSNYSFSFVQAAGNASTLTIVQRALTLTADPISRVYGSANPTADTATAGATTETTGLVNGDTITSETVTSPASSGSGVGSYALGGSAAQFGSGLASNYTITYAANAIGLSITPAALTLTYTASPVGSTYGQAPAGLTGATALTGLVNDDSAASVTSGSAQWTSAAGAASNVGRYAITGSGISLASANYTLSSVQAPGNATALTINPALLSITYTANPASRTYGAQTPALSGSEMATGLVNDDTLGSVTSGAATYTGAAGTTANVGSYAITGAGLTGSSANYTYSFVQAPANATALAVTPAAVTITYTASPQTSLYGNTPTGLSGSESASGLVNDDTLGSITSGTASYATTATSASTVGTYAVAGSGLAADSSNYNFSFVQAPGNATALTIVPRPITVTADPQERDVGAADPLFTYVLTGPAATTGGTAPGLVNGDTLTGQLASTATLASPSGTYDIVQGTLAASPNYQLTYVGNVLMLGVAAMPIADVINTITANLPDQAGGTTPDDRKKQAESALAAAEASGGLHPPQISQSMINDHLVTTPSPVNEAVTSNGNSSLWSPTAP